MHLYMNNYYLEELFYICILCLKKSVSIFMLGNVYNRLLHACTVGYVCMEVCMYSIKSYKVDKEIIYRCKGLTQSHVKK